MNDILKLSRDDLKEIGIDKLKERKLIFLEIEKLTSSTQSSRSESTLQTTSVEGQFGKKYRKVDYHFEKV